MKVSTLARMSRKKAPKTWEKLDKRWDMKMMGDVMNTAMSVINNVNPRLKKLAKEEEYIIDSPNVERKLWKLLCRVRRISLIEERTRINLKEANQVLRSTYSIASRQGKETNWSAFTARVKRELDRQHKIIYKKR